MTDGKGTIAMTYLTVVTLHLLGAVVWIGGILFLGLVLAPILRGRPVAERVLLLQAVGRRFLRVGWAALGTLLATGPVLWALRSFEVTTALVAKLQPRGDHSPLQCASRFLLGATARRPSPTERSG